MEEEGRIRNLGRSASSFSLILRAPPCKRRLLAKISVALQWLLLDHARYSCVRWIGMATGSASFGLRNEYQLAAGQEEGARASKTCTRRTRRTRRTGSTSKR